MVAMPAPTPPQTPRDPRNAGRRPGRPEGGWPRWAVWAGLAVLLALFLVPQLLGGDGGRSLSYSEFQRQVENKQIRAVPINTESHATSGTPGDLKSVV